MGKMFFKVFGLISIFALCATGAWGAVTSPTPGEAVPAGSTYPITWEPISGATAYDVYLSYDNKVTWGKINGTTKVSDLTYDWSVKALTKTKTTCFVKVAGFNGATKVGTVLSSAFTVSVLGVTAPTVGETIDAGQIYEVTWDTSTAVPVSDANLSYTTDGGLTWKSMTHLDFDPDPIEAFTWMVPQLSATSKLCKVRVILTDDQGITVAKAVTPNFTIKVTKMTPGSVSGECYGIAFTIDGLPNEVPNTVGTDLISVSWDGAGNLHHEILDPSDPSGPPLESDDTTYSVAADGQLTVNTGDGPIHGIASTDAGHILLADTRHTDGWIESLLFIKKSSGLGNSVLSGTYLMGQFRSSSGEDNSTGFLEATFEGDGNATVRCIDGCPDTGDIPFTYIVADDGLVETSMGFKGVVDSTGKTFTVADLDPSDDKLLIIFGIRQPPPDFSFSDSAFAGKFIMTDLGYSVDAERFWTGVAGITANGTGGYSYAEKYSSWGSLETNTGTYTVGDDGTGRIILTVDAVMKGAVSEDGQVFFVVNTDPNEPSFSVGIKKAK
jgi:hypothetical protein